VSDISANSYEVTASVEMFCGQRKWKFAQGHVSAALCGLRLNGYMWKVELFSKHL